jgi:hypothetical protein
VDRRVVFFDLFDTLVTVDRGYLEPYFDRETDRLGDNGTLKNAKMTIERLVDLHPDWCDYLFLYLIKFWFCHKIIDPGANFFMEISFLVIEDVKMIANSLWKFKLVDIFEYLSSENVGCFVFDEALAPSWLQ